MNEFLTWSVLATYAGATAGTAVITQFVKDVGFLKNMSTKIISYVVAAVLLLLSYLFTGQLTVDSGILILICNAVLVSIASNGAYDIIVKN